MSAATPMYAAVSDIPVQNMFSVAAGFVTTVRYEAKRDEC